MLDPERDCLPQSEMTVRSMPKTLVPKGSLNGVVGIGYQLIKMIGKLTHTKEFALDSKLDWPYMVFSMFFPSNKLDERRATIQAAVAHAKNQRFLSRGVHINGMKTGEATGACHVSICLGYPAVMLPKKHQETTSQWSLARKFNRKKHQRN